MCEVLPQISEGVVVVVTHPLAILTPEVFQHIGSSYVKSTVVLREVVSHVYDKHHCKMTG